MPETVAMKFRDKLKLELEEIRAAHDGILHTEDIVEYARNPESALHGCFTWDDTKAAAEYRKWQARQVVQTVYVKVEDDGRSKEAPTYVSLTEDRQGRGGYRLMVDVLSDDELRGKLLKQALAEFDTWKQKYKQIKDLAAVFAERDKLTP